MSMRTPAERPSPGYKSVVDSKGPVADSRKERYRTLTEGIKDDNRRLCLEATLDVMVSKKMGRDANPALVEAVLRGDRKEFKRLSEETDTGDIATYIKHIFPVVTRSFWTSQLFNLISVQPMTGPTARIFYQDVVYGSDGGLYDPSAYSPGARVDQYIDPYYSISTEAPGDTVRELNMIMTSQDVTAENRKLKAKWTDEVEQDIRALFGVDMDSYMIQQLGDEIGREVDQSGLDVLVAGATAGNVNWSSTAAGVYADLDPKIYDATLWDALIDADQLVYEATNRNTTWIIAGATVINRMRKLGTYKLIGDRNGDASIQSAMVFQGLLGERWEVYQARHFPENLILIGFRGSDFSETGAVHSPYIPLEIKDAVKQIEGDSAFKTVRGAMWRGKTIIVNGDFYATVTVTG